MQIIKLHKNVNSLILMKVFGITSYTYGYRNDEYGLPTMVKKFKAATIVDELLSFELKLFEVSFLFSFKYFLAINKYECSKF